MKRFCLIVLLLEFAAFSPLYANEQCGLLVMAHGGTDEWNAAVEAAVEPISDAMPTAIAFGMADPKTLNEAVVDLESQSVACIAVVRLFASAKSFLHQTEYLLGLRGDPPAFFISHNEHGHHGPSKETPAPISSDTKIAISQEGLLDAPEMGSVLSQRALELSSSSGKESVLIIAHGPGDDAENAEWLSKLNMLADSVRVTRQFETVEVHTLREDWDEKRAGAETQIRAFVETSIDQGKKVLVIPFRLYGFGPYAEVLEGLTYTSDGIGLLPSRLVTDWIEHQSQLVMQNAGWLPQAVEVSN